MAEGLDTISKNVASCERCPALVRDRTQPVMGEGSIGADLFFVGEAPGRLGADQTGRPFTKDRSGRLLRRTIAALEQAHAGDLEVYITNAVKCNPRSCRGTNRKPKAEEISNCRGYLLAEIRTVGPKVIVPLGRTAAKIILDTSSFPWWTPVPRTPPVFPAKHPGYVVRGGGRERLSETDYLRHMEGVLELLVNTE